MSLFEIIIISFSLSADAFAVAVAEGITIKFKQLKHAIKLAVFFGFFQGFMPLLGWLSGNYLSSYVKSYAHIIAFLLLTIVGCKMIYEAKQLQPSSESCYALSLKKLILLSIATSIDALSIGVTFSLLGYAIMLPIILIGIITFVMSLLGVYIGNKFGCIFKNNFEILAGLLLILIGLKILFNIQIL